MTSPRSRDSRREAARARDKGSSSSRLLLAVLGGGLLVVAAVAAVALTAGAGDGIDEGAASSARPTTSAAASDGGSSPGTAPGSAPVVTGAALPEFVDTAGDEAVGMTIPTVDGADFGGAPVSIALDGRPKVLLFLAHWCSHCQAEVPVMQDWADGGSAPDDVDIISIATAIDPAYPNYPPDAWLESEGWTFPVIVDEPGTVATAYGLTAFPFWVFVDGEGRVTGRMTGELAMNDLETIIDSIR